MNSTNNVVWTKNTLVKKKGSSQTYHEGKNTSRREEREAQMRAQCKRKTLMEKERVVSDALLKWS